jgi:hypothetical protein
MKDVSPTVFFKYNSYEITKFYCVFVHQTVYLRKFHKNNFLI